MPQEHSEAKQLRIFEFGHMGSLALSVARTGFRVDMLNPSYAAVVTSRIRAEDRTRLEAMAHLAKCSLSRMTAELIESALDQLEEELLQQHHEQYEEYIHVYEALCERGLDARD